MLQRDVLAMLATGLVLLGGSRPAAAWCVAGVQRGDSLRVRSGPSPRAREIAAIPPAACGVTIVGPCHGPWCPVSWRGRTGWSNAVFLTRGGPIEAMVAPRAKPPAPPQVQRPTPQPETRRLVAPAREADRTPAAGTVDRKDKPLEEPRAGGIGSAPKIDMPRPAPTAAALPPAASAATAASPVPAQPAPALASPAGTREVCVVNVGKGDTLKVRAGPGRDQALRFGYPSGACGVQVTGPCKDGWCPVDYRGYQGWAEQRHLR